MNGALLNQLPALVAGDAKQNHTKSNCLQEKSQTISNFLRRTDILASRLSLNLSDLPKILGISHAMLFGYRKGSNRITSKVWLKLEAAEQAAGLCEKKPVPVIQSVEIAPAPASEDAASLAGTVAELRDQVRLLTHLVASLLPPGIAPGLFCGAGGGRGPKRAGNGGKGF